MNDHRYERLARTLIEHSTRLQKGEHLLVETWDWGPDLIAEQIQEHYYDCWE